MSHLDDLRRVYLDQPNEVSIETLALCNAACHFCPYPALERKGTKMPDYLIDKIIEEISDWSIPFMFSPFKVNEPLLDKRLFDICERVCKTRGILRLFTNGSPLTEEKIERIAALDKVYHLWISLNSTVPEEYQNIMQMPFEKTAKRLDYLHTVDFPHPVVLSRVGSDKRFLEDCHYRWPKFTPVIIEKSGWLGYTEPDRTEVPDTSCSRWFELSIMADGKVSLCCMHSGADLQWNIGDINTQTLLEVYNSPHWRDRRERMISRREVSPCDQCTY